MFKFLPVLIMLMIPACVCRGQTNSQTALLTRIEKSKPDTNKIALLLQAGKTFLLKDVQNRYSPDSAYILFNRARQLSNSLKSIEWQGKCLSAIGAYFFETNHLKEGKMAFLEAIECFKKEQQLQNEADCWSLFARAMPDSDINNNSIKINYFNKSRDVFLKIKDTLNAITQQKNIAECFARQNKPDTAEKILLQAIKHYKAAGYKNLHDTYDALAQIYGQEADLHHEFLYRMEAVKSMEASGDRERADYFYAKLALTYSDMKMYKESAQWILNAIEAIKKKRKYEDLYGDVSLLVFDYIMLKEPEKALAFLGKISGEIPPANLAQKVDLNEEFAHCYVEMKNYPKAEQYYMEMMRIFAVTGFNKAYYSNHEQMVLDFIYYNQTVGNFYALSKNYKKAGQYFNKILNLPAGEVRPITLGEIHEAQFRVDSASGNYIAAIRHFESYQNLHDSLFNATKNKQIQELQIQYETDKKDKDLRLKQKDIALLTNKSQLQDAHLKRASFTRNIIIASAIALLALAIIAYRVKQRHNIALQKQQAEINKQNLELQEAIAQQKKLVNEKEWLMKEIHHRVKNNLQIVISLLNVQSDYLDSPSAINAIQESRERMQAIALIHQKLYQSGYGTLIKMKSYIDEMVTYLKSFTSSDKILIAQSIEDIDLDVSQAVPLGLIMNEAITNALKYAFPENSRGKIIVELRREQDDKIIVTLQDNGKGFPPDFNFSENKSLGIQLMKLFSEQLDGKLSFENNGGAKIRLVFKKRMPINPLSFSKERDGRA